ncbi:hypothetical protein J1N35_025724 [Gossypium stocksii]|uniref:Uncharacterized protein n=1 Tax=Gossypium stocksii TaxID=47602 RepID=A0A9D3ZXY5_9ROSI|nr:hypothetical protein J1N35_025724 [Gossypium stocksii]
MNLFSTIGAQISGSVWTLANVKADKTYVFNCPQVLAEKGGFLLGSTCACRPGDVFRSNFMPLIWESQWRTHICSICKLRRVLMGEMVAEKTEYQEFVTLLFGRESVGNNGGRRRRRALPPLLRGAQRKIQPRVFELEFKPDGKLCYANNSSYKNDTMIRKEVFLTTAVLKECRCIIAQSKVC